MEISAPPKQKKCISFLYMLWLLFYLYFLFLSVVNLEKSDVFFVSSPPECRQCQMVFVFSELPLDQTRYITRF